MSLLYFFSSVKNKVENVFDTDFVNSVIYSQESDYQIRSAASEWHFKYTGTYLALKARSTLVSTFPQWSQIAIIINGVFFQAVSIGNNQLVEIELPSGLKNVQLIEGLISKPSDIIGVFLTKVYLEKNKFKKFNETPVTEKLLFLGDSITVGANATKPSVEGYPHLFKYEDGYQIGVLGYGYGKVKDFGENQTKIDAVIAHITEMFSNVTSSKKLIISLGTNDFALDGTSSATLESWYANLVDQIYTSDNNIKIFCISPIIRSSDGALLDAYRTSISNICSSREFATHIDGKTILSLSDLDDGVHPTTAGHKKYKDGISSIIGLELLELKTFDSIGDWLLYQGGLGDVAEIADDGGVNKLHLDYNSLYPSQGPTCYKTGIFTVGDKLRITLFDVNLIEGNLRLYVGNSNGYDFAAEIASNGIVVIDNINTAGFANNYIIIATRRNGVDYDEGFVGSIKVEKY